MTVERRVLTECLRLYRDLPCLWDNRLVLYTNKEARDQAYEVLLEKYRQVQEDATMTELKKKIENMRTSYRRERKKVLMSRMNDGSKQYSPQLWYYNLMSFLDEIMDFTKLDQTQENGDTSSNIEFDEDTSSSLKKILESPEPRTKKRKMSTIYLQDQFDCYDDVEHDVEENNQITEVKSDNTVCEAESFGTTVGLQLKELDLMQKIHAEKLISDVIYNARLGRLTLHSNLNVD